MTTTPEQTFHDASLTIVEFARRWREGKASPSELEDTDVLLLGLRRLLADHKAEVTL
jgi:pyruvate/2-oxoglutarate dehydrogenase complex dihydrolipoamide acyltransferase (E2) component